MYTERNILQNSIMDFLLRKLKAFLKLIHRLERAEVRALQHFCLIFSLLHRACCRVTQLLYQVLHIYKIYKIYTLKHSDMFRS